MITAYSVNLSFGQIIEHIESVVNFADAGNIPYTPEQVAYTAYNLIFATGHFTDPCRHWNTKAETYKNRDHFKLFFAKEYHTWRETQPSSVGAHFPSANALEKKTSDDTSKYLIPLSHVTTSDRNN